MKVRSSDFGISHKSQSLEAGMPVLADDDMVMHRNAKRTGGLHDRLRHVDIRPRRGGITGRMIVQLPTELSIQLNRKDIVRKL